MLGRQCPQEAGMPAWVVDIDASQLDGGFSVGLLQQAEVLTVEETPRGCATWQLCSDREMLIGGCSDGEWLGRIQCLKKVSRTLSTP